MLILKHLKTIQHVSIIIQIIITEFVGSLLKSRSNVVMRQHNVWCVWRNVWWGMLEVCSSTYLTTCSVTHLHQTLCCCITTFKRWQTWNSVTLTRNLWTPWWWSEWWSKHVGVFLSVLILTFWTNIVEYVSASVGIWDLVNYNAWWNNKKIPFSLFVPLCNYSSPSPHFQNYSISVHIFPQLLVYVHSSPILPTYLS
jgi:hypothetical protein